MSTYKSNQYCFYCKLNNHYQTMVVSSYIEHIMLVPYTVNAVEHLLYIRKTCPLCFFHFLEPVLKCSFCIRVFCIVFNYFTSCYDSHNQFSLYKNIYYILKYKTFY